MTIWQQRNDIRPETTARSRGIVMDQPRRVRLLREVLLLHRQLLRVRQRPRIRLWTRTDNMLALFPRGSIATSATASATASGSTSPSR